MRLPVLKVVFSSFVFCNLVPPANAEVVRLAIDSRSPDRAHSGYEVIRGRLFGEVDPAAAANRVIQDIGLAPRNERGKVEYVATFTLARPIDPTTASGVLVAAIPNRGNRSIPTFFDAIGSIEPALARGGHALLWIGWQGDLVERPDAATPATALRLESIKVPVAIGRDGRPLTGSYLMRFPVTGGRGPSGDRLQLGQGGAGALAYPPASYDTRKANLTGGPPEDRLGKPTGRRSAIPARDWQWWNCKADAAPIAATPPADICIRLLRGEFNPAYSYTLTFTARDPLVLGLGMAAMRDGVSFFRNAPASAANPLAGQVRHVVAQGQSQVGNLVRTFIALGFNADEQGRRVWDGANSHIGGRRTPINYRFATPGSSTSLYMPGSEGVMWWGSAVGGMPDGKVRSTLDRCRVSGTCPKIFESFGGAELWNQRFTPDLAGFDLAGDIAPPPDVRRYYLPATTHGGGRGGFKLVQPRGECVLPMNPNPQTDQMRALLAALIAWVADGREPPVSAYPRLGDGSLVRAEIGALREVRVPGVPPAYGLANPVLVYDYGPRFDRVDMSGIISRQPPRIRRVIPALVAQVDADGNEQSGVPSVQLMAPLGTYLSWNLNAQGPYAGQLCSFNGGFVPFARTAKERIDKGDPRPSIEERYRTRGGYLATVRTAVDKAQSQGFLLADDAARLLREASEATEIGDLSFMPR